MSDGILTFSHGEVRLGSELLDGILVSASVRGQVRFDEAEVDGQSGKRRTPMGWEDCDITIEVDLLTDSESDTCYDKLLRLDGRFRGHDTAGNPQVLDVANAHANARNINQVVFAALDSRETDQDDVIRATLGFTEHTPVITETESRVAMAGKAVGSGAAPGGSVADPGLDQTIAVEVD